MHIVGVIGGHCIHTVGSVQFGVGLFGISGVCGLGSIVHRLFPLTLSHLSPFWHRSCCPKQSGHSHHSNGSQIPLLLHGRSFGIVLLGLFGSGMSQVLLQILSPHNLVFNGHLGMLIDTVFAV